MVSESSDCSGEVFIEDMEEEAAEVALPPQEVSSQVSTGEQKKHEGSKGCCAWEQF